MQSTVFPVGKLSAQQEDAFTLPAGSTGSSLVYLQDKLSSRRFLVDFGASVSVFSAPTSSSTSGVKLLTAETDPCYLALVQESSLFVLAPAVSSGFFS